MIPLGCKTIVESTCEAPKDHLFIQAEDGIRDLYVTGVQTCALPISLDVLDERHLENRAFVSGRDVADRDRHAEKSGELRGAPPAFAGDDVEPVAGAANDDRLNDAVGFDRVGE